MYVVDTNKKKKKKRSPTINTEDISKPHPVGARHKTTPYECGQRNI
jgi:hypothetical protein